MPPLDETRLFLNGNLQLCSTDEARYHESLVHPAMALAGRPRRVLILGGGDGCALREVLKYKFIKEITLVDLDPAVTGLAGTHPLLTRLNNNAFQNARVTALTAQGISPGPARQIFQAAPKVGRKGPKTGQPAPVVPLAEVRVMNVDADKFLEKVAGFWDVIIVDMPDPSTPELTKLYSREFYTRIRRHLSSRRASWWSRPPHPIWPGRVSCASAGPWHRPASPSCPITKMSPLSGTGDGIWGSGPEPAVPKGQIKNRSKNWSRESPASAFPFPHDT